MEFKENKWNDYIEHPIVDLECDNGNPTSKQPAESGNEVKPKIRISLPDSNPKMEITSNGFGNTKKEQKPDIIQWAKRDNPEIRHNLPFTPMPVRQTYLRIRNEAEKSSTMTQQISVIKEDKRQDGNVIQLTDNKMVQTDASGSPRLDDQDKELLNFYKINKIPPSEIISIIKKSKYFSDAHLNQEVSNVFEQKESQIKIPTEEESNNKSAHQEEKEQGILDKLLQLSENNKQILLKYFENENNMANTEQVEVTPSTENTDSAINITNRKEYNEHLRRSILFEIYQLFKRENNMLSKGSKRNASAKTFISESSQTKNLPHPPWKRAKASSKHTYLPQESQTFNMTTDLSYNNIQQCPAQQYGYELHQNEQINTMANQQAVAPYPVRPRIPSHYQMARFHGEGASFQNPMQMYHQNMQPSANANQLYVRPQEPLQINQQNIQMEYQGYRSHTNQQHILNEQATTQQENWRRLQQLREYRRELEQQKLPVYYPNTQWSEYQRMV